MRSFEIPPFYRSPIISRVKQRRKAEDPRKKDFTPTLLDFGSVRILLARHFGFCFGVEHAIEQAYKAIAENPGKRIFLLSQMIHNPEVNADLESEGVQFLMDTKGNIRIPFEALTPEDVVIVPAFGTTVEIEERLLKIGVDLATYNTTCPFVEKVWNRADKLGQQAYTVVVHGKPDHEETRATFSHAAKTAPVLVVKDHAEAEVLASMLRGKRPWTEFSGFFGGRTTPNFDPQRDLQRFGVVNQTTMLASETQGISALLEDALKTQQPTDSFANTRDTLCYATNDNQQATQGAIDSGLANLAIVVGGYNSSNTSHLVELCEEAMPTYFIRNEQELFEQQAVRHFKVQTQEEVVSRNPWPAGIPTVLVTSGASCPDASVDRVIQRLLMEFPGATAVDEVLAHFDQTLG
jgi:4-hydroxy-3-methylbut-2-enyl diphosphate reductase